MSRRNYRPTEDLALSKVDLEEQANRGNLVPAEVRKLARQLKRGGARIQKEHTECGWKIVGAYFPPNKNPGIKLLGKLDKLRSLLD